MSAIIDYVRATLKAARDEIKRLGGLISEEFDGLQGAENPVSSDITHALSLLQIPEPLPEDIPQEGAPIKYPTEAPQADTPYHVLADRLWTLDPKARRKKGDKVPTTWTCPQCYGVWPGTPVVCPGCGYREAEKVVRKAVVYKVTPGELVEAGVPEGEAVKEAARINALLGLDAKTRQKALLARAFELATEGDEGKRKMKALAGAVGYKESWTTWAWRYVQGKRGGGN